ncbi:DUF4185 domain-containing protein [Thermomonospora umbrina]|uniref:Uncharacterized protein DUF5005 n=1 Tax=Thermomonospora umbrina TaxID=111806 RepID=A0A3D9ST90_9ACTN|nr:DUF4185 domain-containing protein [Thermomonospora umbrina]REE98827.1 uncharacterized protein DUF5005 [Thermomonospora umbrina]
MRSRALWRGLAAGALTFGLSFTAIAPADAAPPKPGTATVTTSRGLDAPAPASCQGVPTPAFQGTERNVEVNDLFDRYGNDNSRVDDWTGADGTYSTELPDGRLAFVFSDTFLGKVNADGSRSPVIEEGGTTPFLNNTFVVKDGDRLKTITGGTKAAPKAVMPPRDSKHWYWAGDAITAAGLVQTTYQEYERFGTGAWDWRWHRNVVATFAPGRLDRPLSVKPLPSGNGIAWASWLEKVGGHIYVYGVEDHGATKYMHLARVKGNRLTGAWEFYKGDGTWSAKESDSARMMDGVANEYSVSRLGGGYVLITQDTTEQLSSRVVAYFSCSPEGPFTGKTLLYNTPETGALGSYGNPNVFTYNAHAHPELSTGNRIVVSYNVNTFVNTDHYRDVSIYRPRFIDVKFG